MVPQPQNGGALTQIGMTELSCIALFMLISMVINWNTSSMTFRLQGDVVKGEWQGKLAASLGLSGDVASLEFSRLAEGIHAPMVRHRLAMEYKNPDGTVTKAVEQARTTGLNPQYPSEQEFECRPVGTTIFPKEP